MSPSVMTALAAAFAAAPVRSDAPLSPLLRTVEPIAPETSVADVGARMLDARYDALLSLPVVAADGRPVGCISRYELMRVFLMSYGRELYGRRPIAELMNRSPLVLAIDTPIEDAARRIGAGIRSPITEDFIVTAADGGYLGAGVVMDVLRATESQLAQRSRELEQAYARLQSSQSQLVQSEKMASLGQMVAGLAHEINTPLGYVRNNVELLRDAHAGMQRLLAAYERVSDGTPDALDAAAAALDAARSEVDRDLFDELPGVIDDTLHGVAQIAELVGNLKDFSRLDQARTERTDVHRLLENALKIAGHVLRKRGIEVERDYHELPEVGCAAQQINQVLLNLLTNAAQAIEHAQGRIVLRTRRLAGSIGIAVEDNGKGIAPEHLPRIFDPFFTTKPVGEGTGLGLSICYQIVRQHGGSIRAVSKPGVGTRFMLVLPLQPFEESVS